MTTPLIWVTLLCLFGSVIYKKWVSEKALRKLYALKMKQDTDNFLKMIDSPYCKFNFSKVSLQMMKLNYFMDLQDHPQVQKTYDQMTSLKMNADEKIALYSRMFGYALQFSNRALAEACRDQLTPLLSGKKGEKAELIRGEVEQLDRIYIQKDTSLIQELIEALPECENDEIKSLIAFRIAKLYHYLNEPQQVEIYLNRAMRYTNHDKNRKSLMAMISDPSELD